MLSRMTGKKNLGYYEYLIILFTFGYNYYSVFGFQFKIERVLDIDRAVRRFPNLKDHPLSQLTNTFEAYHKLCDEVTRHVHMTYQYLPNEYLSPPRRYWITYHNYSGVHAVAIVCRTDPAYSYVRLGKSNDELKIVLVDRVNVPISVYEFSHLHPFIRMNDKERRKICRTVKIKASLDGLGHEIPNDMLTIGNYSILREDEEELNAIVLSCETIPKTFLRLGNSNEKIIVMMKHNMYKYLNFQIERVKPHQVRGPIPLTKESQEYDFSKYSNDEKRLFMCFAAKKRILQKIPDIKVVLQRSVIEEAQLFEIEIQENVKTERVVVSCASSPPMYVYFDESEPPDGLIQIILIDEPSESVGTSEN